MTHLNQRKPMSEKYTSILICYHDDHTDIFRNGLPLGVIAGGKFNVHENVMPDGTRVPVEIRHEEQLIQAVSILTTQC